MSAIRILRIIEYVYATPEAAERDQARWTHSILNDQENMRSATLPFEFIDWSPPSSPVTRAHELIHLLHQVDGHLGLAVHRGDGANPDWRAAAEQLITRIRAAIAHLEGDVHE